jgi:VanZ family protein
MVRRFLLKRAVAALLAVGFLLALFVGGAQPEAAGLIPAPWDKLVHVAAFLVLTLLFIHGFALPWGYAAGAALLTGLADEWHQRFLPGRSASVEDWLADLTGVLLAAALLWWWRSRRV